MHTENEERPRTSPEPPAARRRRRPGRWLAGIGAVLAVAIGLIVNFLVRQGVEGGLERVGILEPESAAILEDDFSDPRIGWPTDDWQRGRAGYTDDAYEVISKLPDSRVRSILVIPGPPYQAVTIEVDARKAAANTPEGLFGVSCVRDPEAGAGYSFLVDPDGRQYVIVKFDGGAEKLTGGRDFAGTTLRSRGGPDRIRGDCFVHEDGSTKLALHVDGRQVLSVSDPEGLKQFVGMGLTVYSLEGGTHVVFDNASMTELGEAPDVISTAVSHGEPAGPMLGVPLIFDEFSNHRSGWGRLERADVRFGYRDGQYQIDVKRSGQARYWVRWVGSSHRGVSVQANVGEAPGSESGLLGVMCLADPERHESYAFVINPAEGTFAFHKLTNKENTILESGRSHAILGGAFPNVIRGDCVGQPGRGRTILSLYVNGELVDQHFVPNGFPRFRGAGMYAESETGPMDARFDDLIFTGTSR